jgi:hypothetical protein
VIRINRDRRQGVLFEFMPAENRFGIGAAFDVQGPADSCNSGCRPTLPAPSRFRPPVFGDILAADNEVTDAQAVGDGVEAGGFFTFRGFRTGGMLRVAPVSFV